jgi:ubiquinone/menaquinone biosynthesis C-methylase UbiE
LSDQTANYVLGHTDHERRRLALQAAVLNPLTDAFLRRAGISAGMNVLELGCGIGEVSLIATRLVGPHGRLHCLDFDGHALEIARGRVRSAGHDHVVFEQIDIHEHAPVRPYDAVIGRHILVHTPDPLAILHKAVSLLQPGGVAAFQEGDFTYCPRGYPELKVMWSACDWIIQFMSRAVSRPKIGAQLFQLMQEAGLQSPECRAECVMDGGPHSPMYEWIAETVRSLLPRMEALGITTAAEVDIETLADRMRTEALEKCGAGMSPMLIGAFARKPHGK